MSVTHLPVFFLSKLIKLSVDLLKRCFQMKKKKSLCKLFSYIEEIFSDEISETLNIQVKVNLF